MFFERLTDDEKNLIDRLREYAADNDGGNFFKGSFVKCQDWLRYWEFAKAELGEAFGDGLILRKPVTVTVEDDELHDAMSRVQWDLDWEKVKNAIFNGLRSCNKEYDYHCWGSRSDSLRNVIRNYLFSVDAFISNRYDYDSIEINLPDGSVMKLAKGCKVMKAIGRLAKVFHCEQEFENIRVKQSQILNDARISSTLCLSIHPLDYMTASYNNNDWRSCMNWEDGEYRRGVIEMMNSDCVVVAYLESKHEKMRWGQYTWNSKKWREFFIVRPDLICGIKGYPYWNRVLEDEVLKWLRDLYAPIFSNVTFSNSITTFRTDSDKRYINNDALNVHDVRLCMSCGPAMYNDFYEGNDYHCIISSNMADNDNGVIYIDYSGASECTVCGQCDVEFDGEGVLICEECTEHHYCCSCGDPIMYAEDLRELNGREYCDRCFDSLPRCEICDEITDVGNDMGSIEFGVYLPRHMGEEPNERNAVLVERIHDWADRRARTVCTCGNCSRDVFVAGSEEVDKSHPYLYLNCHYYTMLPWDALTVEGKELFPSVEVQEAKDRINEEGYQAFLEDLKARENIFY